MGAAVLYDALSSRYTFEPLLYMPDAVDEIEIPHRALFKAVEVCDILKVQPYVLRSWEAEFPGLGVAKTTGGPRVYRRVDVEQVARIRHLLLVEGLTLAGARRKLEEEAAPVGGDESAMDELVGQNARERLTAVKRGLRSILDLLASNAGEEFRLASPEPAPSVRARRTPIGPVGHGKPARRATGRSRTGSKPPASARRKRSA